ncbi:hypothetical protein [Caballeronia sp. dw_276]|nr:hypothetical protein [Caballeronia sp. dw_276]
MHTATITLRTAEIFAAELTEATPFITVVRASAAAQSKNRDALVGQIFED